MANPSGNQEGNNNNNNNNPSNGGNGVSNGRGNPNNGNSNVSDATAEGFRKVKEQLRHCPRLAMTWTSEEQSILEEALAKYSSEPKMTKYANIVELLEDKTMRDVVIRCRWMMTQKESGKRKTEDHNLPRKNRDKKEKIANPSAKSSSKMSQAIVPQQALPAIPMDDDDDISYREIGGATGQLLEKNWQLLNQISAHFTSLQVQENVNLFSQVWDNILTVMNDFNEMPDIMKQMPPLPVKMNEQLFNSIVPRTHL